MSYSIEITPQALNDIEAAYRWIANNLGTTFVKQWYQDLAKAIAAVSFNSGNVGETSQNAIRERVGVRSVIKRVNLSVVGVKAVSDVCLRSKPRRFVCSDLGRNKRDRLQSLQTPKPSDSFSFPSMEILAPSDAALGVRIDIPSSVPNSLECSPSAYSRTYSLDDYVQPQSSLHCLLLKKVNRGFLTYLTPRLAS